MVLVPGTSNNPFFNLQTQINAISALNSTGAPTYNNVTVNGQLYLNGNMSGPSNIFTNNLAVNSGLAAQQATIGYNGLKVVGQNGTTSFSTVAGNAVIAGGTGNVGSLSVPNGGISMGTNVSNAEFYLKGNMSGPSNIYGTNIAADIGIAAQQITAGYNGLAVVGLIGTNSIYSVAGNAVIAGGSGCFGDIIVPQGNARIGQNIYMTGTLYGTAVNVNTVTATSGTLTGLTVSTIKAPSGDIKVNSDIYLSGNMSGPANVFVNNVAVNNGIAAQQATIGFNGLTVVGQNGLTSLKTIAGNAEIASGTGCVGSLSVNNGGISMGKNVVNAEFYLSGNMSGPSNIYGTNLAIDEAISTQQATIGYDGLTIVGLNDTNSLTTIGGNTVIASGTGCYGDLIVPQGNIRVGQNIYMSGAFYGNNLNCNSLYATGSVIFNTLVSTGPSPTISVVAPTGIHGANIIGNDSAGVFYFTCEGATNNVNGYLTSSTGAVVRIDFNTPLNNIPFIVWNASSAYGSKFNRDNSLWTQTDANGFTFSTFDTITNSYTGNLYFAYQVIAQGS